MALTPKMQAFVQEYLVDLNGKEAAIRAGYKPSNARDTASDLLHRPSVQEAMRVAMAARAERVEDSADAVLRDLRQLQADAAAAGQFGPAIKACELRGKHLGMFRERVSLEAPDGGPATLVLRWQGPEADQNLTKLQERWNEPEEE